MSLGTSKSYPIECLRAEREDGVQIFEDEHGRFIALHPKKDPSLDRFSLDRAMEAADTEWLPTPESQPSRSPIAAPVEGDPNQSKRTSTGGTSRVRRYRRTK